MAHPRDEGSDADKTDRQHQGREAGRRPRDFPVTEGAGLVVADFTETPRQRQVLDAVTRGLENKEIAETLGISEQRAKELVSALLKKFGVRGRTDLARAAVNMRILGSISSDWVPYSYLFDEAPVLIAITQGPDHRFVLVNSAYVQAFGERHYIGRTVRECFPDAPEEALAAVDRTYAGRERYAESELRTLYQMPDGGSREFVLSFINEPIRSASNEITGIVFYGWDVSAIVARRGAVERVSIEQKRLLDQLPNGIIRLGLDDSTLFVNLPARALLAGDARSDAADAVSLPDLVLLNAEAKTFPVGESPSAIARRGLPFDGDGLVRRMDGAIVSVHIKARPHRDETGALTGVLIVLQPRNE